jgi:dUTP pyrophosphatase
MRMNDSVTICINGGRENIPEYGSSEAAGADIRAGIVDPVSLAPGERALIPTGIRMAVPTGFEVQIRPRSGLALNKGLTVLNSPGTIDSDYRGELGIIIINLGNEAVVIEPGERIAQMVVSPVVRATFQIVETLPATGRGSGGFGSTGHQ